MAGWNDLKIKYKLMSVIVLIVFVSMGITLLIVSNILQTRMEKRFRIQMDSVGGYVQELFKEYETKSLNYVSLFMYDTTLKEAAHHATTLKWRDPLINELKGRFKALDLDALEVGDVNNKVLVRAENPKKFGDDRSELLVIKEALEGKITVDVGEDKEGIFAIRAGGKVEHEGTLIGTVMTGIYLDDKFAQELRELSGAEISIINNDVIVATTLAGLKGDRLNDEQKDAIRDGEVIYDKLKLDGNVFSSRLASLGSKQSAIMVALDRSDLINSQRQTTAILLTILGISCIVAVIIGYFVAYGMIRPIFLLTVAAEVIASKGGDLTQRVKVYSKDEIGTLADVFNRIMQAMHDIMLQIENTANKVASYSEQLSSSTEEINASTQETSAAIQHISQGAINQSARVEEASQIITSSSASLKQIGVNAQTATQEVKRTNDRAQEGRVAVQGTVEKINRLTETVTNTAVTIQGLGEKSQQIGEITETISSIADQTNLLALNAAIEAARAGEAGRGFAVVAEEVRKLAETSSQAVKKIGNLVKYIQTETNLAVKSIEISSKEVQEGKKLVVDVADILTQISDAIEQATVLMEQISGSTEKQMEDTERVVTAINQVASIAKESVASAEEVASTSEEQTASMQEMSASSQELAHAALELRSMVGKFKLEKRK